MKNQPTLDPYKSLDENEVRRRLTLYKDKEVTDELYDFGKFLIAEESDRLKQLDSKATAITAYSIGVITLLASTYGLWSKAPYSFGLPLPLLGAACALASAFFAVKAATLYKHYWFSADEWLQLHKGRTSYGRPGRISEYQLRKLAEN
jgi:hypothetical protein